MINKTHGKNGTPIYRTWIGIKSRCLNTTDKDYKDYGGRGIGVCMEWKNNFENFYRDMGEKPKGLTIDRIDVNRGYCKENCRWATIREQNHNKRNNHILIFNEKKDTITNWSKKIKIPVSTLQNRLLRGWSIEKTLTFPIQIHNKKI